VFEVSISSLDTLDWVINALVVAGTVTIFAVLWSPAIRGSRTWRATVTPLASIIGSGFLVVAPLLGYTVGHWAFIAMLGIVLLANGVGSAVRYNILHVEDISDAEDVRGAPEDALKWLERVAKLVLAFAYIIAITFYLELLAAFVLKLFDVQDRVLQKEIASALIVFIGVYGFWRGLKQLELLEKFSVDTKLAIIAGFLLGLAFVNVQHLVSGTWALPRLDVEWNIDTIRKLLGAFLIVQGFETSRYMGNVYKAGERVSTMRYAQLTSAGIYLVFIGLATLLLGSFSSISETGIITLSARVAAIMPILLVIGAAMAQFSAAVADTLASGGLVEDATYGAVKDRYVYLAVMLLSLALLWTSHILEIIAFASRAFAAYYAIQCGMAAFHSALPSSAERNRGRAVLFAVLSVLMVLTALFGIPAEAVGS
jgi:hypothetical protein